MESTKRNLFQHFDGPGITRSPSSSCPICDTHGADFAIVLDPSNIPFERGWCPACSNFYIARDAIQLAREQKRAHLLSAYLRKLPEKEGNRPILLDDIDNVTSTITQLSIVDQFDLALKVICQMCPLVGQQSRFDYSTDWPLLIAQGAETAFFIVGELATAGYLKEGKQGVMFPPRPTWKAYARLQEIQASGRQSEVGFVAMSFSAEQLQLWLKAIKPGIENAGYRPFRVDQDEHNRRIDDEIIAGIRRCRFLVADFTEQKRGVYFEAGMALGLGRNVIWMCNESEVGDLHFDTRQFNHILYTDLVEAKNALTNRIVALEGQGTYVRESD